VSKGTEAAKRRRSRPKIRAFIVIIRTGYKIF
jgi:hypothetical protein